MNVSRMEVPISLKKAGRIISNLVIPEKRPFDVSASYRARPVTPCRGGGKDPVSAP